MNPALPVFQYLLPHPALRAYVRLFQLVSWLFPGRGCADGEGLLVPALKLPSLPPHEAERMTYGLDCPRVPLNGQRLDAYFDPQDSLFFV